MCREQADFCPRGFRNDLTVWFDACFGIGFSDAVSAKLRRSFLGSRRGRMPDDEARLRTNQQRAGDEKTSGVSQMNAPML
jgi:hypothetical protein